MSGEATKKVIALRDSMRVPAPEHEEACRAHRASTERLKASAARTVRTVRDKSITPARLEKP